MSETRDNWLVWTLVAFSLWLSVSDSGVAETPPKYDRSEWGRWAPTGERGPNGCRWGARHAALKKIATPGSAVVRDVAGKACRVEALVFTDPYTGKRYAGPGSKVDVDHVVPLAEAHRSGGWKWDREKRLRFWNDPENHIPTEQSVNRSKSDRDPGGENYRGSHRPWLPPDLTAHCLYVERWISIKAKWALTADKRESAALVSVLLSCSGRTQGAEDYVSDWCASKGVRQTQ